jgi:hypothetical protein
MLISKIRFVPNIWRMLHCLPASAARGTHIGEGRDSRHAPDRHRYAEIRSIRLLGPRAEQIRRSLTNSAYHHAERRALIKITKDRRPR